MRDRLAYERNTVKRLLFLGIVLAFLPIYIYAVLGIMVDIGWIATDFPALDMIWMGISLAISIFGMSLVVVGFYMANKNIKERD